MNRPNPDNFLVRLWNLLGSHPLATLTGLVVAQTVLTFWRGELWYTDEVRHASVLQNLLRSGHWLLLQMNGEPYVDKPPVYFWFVALLVKLLGTDRPPVFFLAAALSGWFFLLSTYWLGRVAGGTGGKAALTGVLVLLTNFFFLERCHQPRMDLLFATFINLAGGCLFRGWSRPGFSGWTLAGFALAALGTLTKGPLALVFPLVASFAWLAWQRRGRRFFRLDAALGFGLYLLLVGGWVWGCFQEAGAETMRNLFQDQLLHRAVRSPQFHEPFYHYAWLLAALWLPWTLLLFFLPVHRLFRREFWSERWAARGRSENDGAVFLWCLAVGTFLVLSAMSYKVTFYLLYVFAPLAVLTGRGLLRVEPARTVRLAGLLAVIFILAGLVLPWADHFYPWPELVRGLAVSGVICLGVGCLMYRWRRQPPEHILLVAALGMVLATQPIYFFTRPGLDAANSPEQIGRIIRREAGNGCFAVTFQLHEYRPGTLDYYTGPNLSHANTEADFRRLLAQHPKLVVLTGEIFWNQWRDRPAGLKVIHTQWIGWERWLVAVQDGPATKPPP